MQDPVLNFFPADLSLPAMVIRQARDRQPEIPHADLARRQPETFRHG